MSNEIYLDNAATSIPCQESILAFQEALQKQYYNPSALYKPALEIAKKIETCRLQIANLLNTDLKQVIYTASGTDANNFAILSLASKLKAGEKVLYTKIEHPSIIETCKSLSRFGVLIEEIPVSEEGIICLENLEKQLNQNVKLMCIAHVNNELGSINPIAKILELRNRLAPDAHIHVDGVQGFLKLPFSFKSTPVDSYAISAHKLYSSKGLGALILNKNTKLPVYRYGGGQEFGLLSGTENTPGIFAFSAAIKSLSPVDKYRESLWNIKKFFVEQLENALPEFKVLGPSPYDTEKSAPQIINIALPPLRSDVMLNALANEGIYCSSGAACSSMKQKVSRVLQAIQAPKHFAESAIRVSFAPYNTKEDIEKTIAVMKNIYEKFAKYTRR